MLAARVPVAAGTALVLTDMVEVVLGVLEGLLIEVVQVEVLEETVLEGTVLEEKVVLEIGSEVVESVEGRVVRVVPGVETVTVGATVGTVTGTLVSPEVAVPPVEVEMPGLELELGHGETVGRPSGQTPRGVSQIKNPKKQPIWRTIVGATIVNWPRQGTANERRD